MALYQFKSDDGELIEREFTPEALMDLPLIGGSLVLREGGKQYRRVKPTIGGIVARLDYDHSEYPKVSKALPQFAAGADFVKESGRNYGCPIITSRRHQDELCRRHGFTRDYSASDL